MGQHVPPNRRLTFSGLHGVISPKLEELLAVTTFTGTPEHFSSSFHEHMANACFSDFGIRACAPTRDLMRKPYEEIPEYTKATTGYCGLPKRSKIFQRSMLPVP
jgi:hypothetical protein